MCPLQDPSQKREVPERSDFKSSAMCGTPQMLHQGAVGARGENPGRMSNRTTNLNPREEFCLSIVDSPSVKLVVAWLLTSHEETLTPMVERRHSTVQHSEGLVQDVLQGSLDQAARASELGAEPGRGSRMSAAHMTGIDSLAAPPVSSAAPEAFVDAGRVSRHSAGGYAQPEDAASVGASQQSVTALQASEGDAQMVDARRSIASDAAAHVSQPGAEVACGFMMSAGAVDIAAGQL